MNKILLTLVLRILPGIFLLLAPLVLIITEPDPEMLDGFLYAVLFTSPEALFLLWRLIAIPLLIAFGTYLIFPKGIPVGLLTIIGIFGAGAYIIYLVLLSQFGHTLLLQYFSFSRWYDFLFLYFIGMLIGFSLRLTVKSNSFLDLYGLVIGYLGVILIALMSNIAGPYIVEGKPLQIVSFILIFPFYILLINSFFALCINLIGDLWREIRRSPNIPAKELS